METFSGLGSPVMLSHIAPDRHRPKRMMHQIKVLKRLDASATAYSRGPRAVVRPGLGRTAQRPLFSAAVFKASSGEAWPSSASWIAC
ncbi:hypothetical protein SAMN03159448_06081 [Sinorhizobium sp. NFACC03]|nr:hypothetical protein SAMN03159448_06081 [Sinorhizobium sp. NFACC03]